MISKKEFCKSPDNVAIKPLLQFYKFHLGQNYLYTKILVIYIFLGGTVLNENQQEIFDKSFIYLLFHNG